MKPFLHIFANINVLALLLFSSLAHSAAYEVSPDKTWHGVGSFDAQVTDVKTQYKYFVTFNAVALEEFDVEIPPNFPRLNPQDAQNCEKFKGAVASWVADHFKIKKYQLRYRGRLGNKGKLHLKLSPRQELNCRLADVALKFDRETCKISLGRLQVIVDISGVVGGFVVDILDSQLSKWTSDAVSYAELKAKETSVICVNKCGEVFTADGHRRSCTLPCITDVAGFANKRVETFAYYVPTQKKYKDAIASTVLPRKKPDARRGEICYLEPNSDDDDVSSNNSERASEVSTYSVEEDDDDDQSEPYRYFEITGPEQEIPVEKNPFLCLKRDGSCHYTKASQVPCCPVINGVLDKTSPHILQLIEETGITTDETHNLGTDEFGLRWPIFLDEENQPILPASCKAQRMPRHCVRRDLRELNMPEGQRVDEIYQFRDPKSVDKSLIDFPRVYNGKLNNYRAVLDYTNTYAHNQYNLYEKMKIHTLPITSLDVRSWPIPGGRCETSLDMGKFPKITKLRLDVGWATNYYKVFSALISKMPIGNVTDIDVVNDDDYRLCFDPFHPQNGELESRLWFRSVSIKGGFIYNYSFIYKLAEFIKKNPNLRELYLDVRFPNNNDPHNLGFNSYPGYSLGDLKPALEKSGLTKLIFVQYVSDYQAQFHHIEYKRLLGVLKDYQQNNPKVVVVFEQR